MDREKTANIAKINFAPHGSCNHSLLSFSQGEVCKYAVQ